LPGAEAAAEAAAAVGCGHDYYVVFLVGGGDLLDVNGSFYSNAKKISVSSLVQNFTSLAYKLLTSFIQVLCIYNVITL
jgi:hypothetical protein